MNEFALIYEEGAPCPFLFRSLSARAEAWFAEHRELCAVVRAVSAIYRKEKVEACTAIAVARDLESSLRTVARTEALTVKAMRFENREAGIVFDPSTGSLSPLVQRVLVEIPPPSSPAGR